MIHPEEMTKLSIVGPKTQLETVVNRLHELNVLHIDDYSTEDGDLDIGDPQVDADELSDTLTTLRSVRAKLPEVDGSPRKENGDVREHIDHLRNSIDDIYSDLDEIREKQEKQQELLDALQVLDQLGLDTDDITEYSSIDMYVGTVADYGFVEDLPDGRYDLYRDGKLMALFIDADIAIEQDLRDADFDAVDMAPVMNIDQDVSKKLTRVQEELEQLGHREEEFRTELQEIAEEWRGYLDAKELELEEQLERAEAPLQFATTGSAFEAEGWIPTDRFDEVKEALEAATDGRVHIEQAADDDPHETPSGVSCFTGVSSTTSSRLSGSSAFRPTPRSIRRSCW
jgi:V/A-type H+-transporting ATPase subunit I